MRRLVLGILLLPTACGGGGGDAPSEPVADALGGGSRLSEVLGPAEGWLDADNLASQGCATPQDAPVHVTGVSIVAIDRHDETGDGALGNFYVQDAVEQLGPYSGVTVFDPSFSPPDLKLATGDVADLDGVYTEFVGPSSGPFGGCKTLPEIGGTMSFRFEALAAEPTTIELSDLRSYPTARRWLGMLVRVVDLTIANDAVKDASGRYTAEIDVGGGLSQADVPSISNELFDLEAEGPPLTAQTTFSSVVGVVTFFYGFKLAPRSAEDFEP